MKTLNHIFWIFLFAVAFSACSKDSEPCDPDDEESPCYGGVSGQAKLLLTEIKRNGLAYYKYEYDNKNKMTVAYFYDEKGSLFLTQMYTYSGGDFPVKTTNKSLTASGNFVWDYRLGSDGRPTSMLQTFPDDPDSTPVDYTFSYSKNTMVETGIPRTKDPHVMVNTYTYNDNGNLLSIVFTQDGDWLTTIEQGNFDDKIASSYYGNPIAWKFPGKNNHGTEKITSKNAAMSQDHIWKYTYNNAGYPITAKVFDKGSDVLVVSYTYSYKPAK